MIRRKGGKDGLMKRPQRIVFLVPGFFGFTAVGDLSYFHDVERTLGEGLKRRGFAARLVRCPTQPTGSIPRRADHLRRQVLRHGGLKATELHFVGHSTGGLDQRLLLSPGVSISGEASEEQIGRRTRTAVSVVTPHYGTPLANFFATAQGHQVLLLLASLATTGQGRGALRLASRATSLLSRLGGLLGGESVTDEALRRVMQAVRFDKDDPVWRYFEAVASDQGAVLQLTPEGTNLFAAAVVDRPGVDYASVVAATPRPPARLDRALLHPQQLALRGLFRLLHGITSRPHARYPYPRPAAPARRRIERGIGFELTPAANDGIVPAMSQVHGRVVHAVRADHLDVVGHYTLAAQGSSNWLPSGAAFTPEQFEALWDDVAGVIAGSETGRSRRAGRAARAAS
jgi:triacylglycerol lipase